MQQIGVMAVVEGLAGFSSDMGKVNSLLDGLKPHATSLMQAFDGIGNAFASFGESVIRVAEVALGVILRDAIEWIIGGLKDMAMSAIEAGAEFQLLEMRLQGMNFQTAIESGLEYSDAMDAAGVATEKQLTWIMKMAAVTPFDATDIANVYTLARSYGFADDAAQELVGSISDYIAGMGLSNVATQRVIINFGQMISNGKITSREMNDLARGAMMPLANVLKIVARNTGTTVQELMRLISKPGGGVPAQEFINAFNEMIATEERFIGASERMARTFKGASENVVQTVRDLLGFYVVGPVLDVLGEKVASFLDALTDPVRWERMTAGMGRIGTALSEVVSSILGLTPNAETLADRVISGVEKIATWIETNKGKIIGFFNELKNILSGKSTQPIPQDAQAMIQSQQAQNGIQGNEPVFGQGILDTITKIRDFVYNELIPAFNSFKSWIAENQPLIDTFFATLGEIASTVLEGLFGDMGDMGGRKTALDILKSFMQWVVDNKEEIAKWVEIFVRFIATYLLVKTLETVALTALINFLGFLMTPGIEVLATFLALLSALTFSVFPQFAASARDIGTIDWAATISGWGASIQTGLAGIGATFMNWASGIGAQIVSWIQQSFPSISLESFGDSAGAGFMQGMKNGILGGMGDVLGAITTLVQRMIFAITGGLAGANVGGSSFSAGVSDGIMSGVAGVVSAAGNLASSAVGTVKTTFKSKSPSEVMMDIGENVGIGLQLGIESSMGPLLSSMTNSMQQVVSAARAVPAQTNASYSYSNAYNLTINSNANAEQMSADFGMMQSMAGV